VSRANIEIEGDFVISGKESISVEFFQGKIGTAHLTQLGSMSLPDTSMAGDLVVVCSEDFRAGRINSNNILPIKKMRERLCLSLFPKRDCAQDCGLGHLFASYDR